MKNSIKCASFLKYEILGLMTLLFCSVMVPIGLQAGPKPLTKSQINDELYKQTRETHIAQITENGAKLVCPVQGIDAEVAKGKVNFTSRLKDQEYKFSLELKSYGKESGAGVVKAFENSEIRKIDDSSIEVTGKGISEKLITRFDGIRQDFIIHSKPNGEGNLFVNLKFGGVTVEKGKDGLVMSLNDSSRRFTYNKLKVQDANKKILNAEFKINSENEVSIVIDDSEAVYPVTIDPTVTDLDWSRMEGGVFGDASMVFAVAVGDIVKANGLIGTGVYVGGRFSKCGDAKNTRNIAAYDFSEHQWLSVGNGLDGPVYAIAVTNNGSMELYVGGAFIYGGNLKSGDTKLNFIARFGTDPEEKDKENAYAYWWRPLSEGMDKPVYAIALKVEGTSWAEVYIGGSFLTTPAKYFARWKYELGDDGTVTGSFDGLNGDFNKDVWAVGVEQTSGTVWVGGEFSQSATDDSGNALNGTHGLTIYKEVVTKDKTTGELTKEWKWLSAGFLQGEKVNTIYVDESNVYVGGYFSGINSADDTGAGTDGVGSICMTADEGLNWIGSGDDKKIIDVTVSNGIVYACDDMGDVYMWDGLDGTGLSLNSIPGVGLNTNAKVFALAPYTYREYDGSGHLVTEEFNVIAGGDFVYTEGGYQEFIPTLPVYTNKTGIKPVEARNVAILHTGTSWEALQQLDPVSLAPVGWAGAGPAQSNHVNAIATTCDGTVFIGGSFTQVITSNPKIFWHEVSANNVAEWVPGEGFQALKNQYVTETDIKGVEGKYGERAALNGVNGEVGALEAVRATSLPPKGGKEGWYIFIGGAFTEACGQEAHHITKVRVDFYGDDTIWYDIGSVKTQVELDGGYLNADDIPVVVTAMRMYTKHKIDEDGDISNGGDEGRRVYVGGSFVEPGKGIAVWDHEQGGGNALGDGVGAESDASPFVYAIGIDNDENVYLGGGFTEPARYLVKYDKEKESYVDINPQMDKPVLALDVDSNGVVYAGGDFTTSASGTPFIARYNNAWLEMPAMVNGPVFDITIDSGDVVYVAGDFSFKGDDSRRCNNIARYEPTDKKWTSLGYGVGVEDASVSEKRSENQQIFALNYNDKLCELEVGGAFTRYKTGTLINQVYSVARCALRYKIVYQVCTSAIKPEHDHDHGYFSPGIWLPNKEYITGDMVISTDGLYLLEASQGGVSSVSEPQWNDLGDTADNSITWTYTGQCVVEPTQDMDIWKEYNSASSVNKSYKVGDMVTDADKKYIYECTAVNGSGHQGGAEPAWNNAGMTTDNDLIWKYVGYSYVELKTYSNKKLVQYVRRGESAIKVTGIPDKIIDSSGREYFLSQWTGKRITTKCVGNFCWASKPSANLIDPYDFNYIYNPLSQGASASYSLVAHFGRMIYVDADAHGGMNGRNWADAYTTLQKAISEAEPYDMILIAKGTYYPSEDGDRNATFEFKKYFKVYGGFDGTEKFSWDFMKRHSSAMNEFLYARDVEKNRTILSGDVTAAKSVTNYTDDPSDNAYHVITGPGFDYDGASFEDFKEELTYDERVSEPIPVLLDGVTVEGGNADGQGSFANGGGLLIKSIPFFARFCTFKNNYAENGGAVYIQPTFMFPPPKTGLSKICFYVLNKWKADRLADQIKVFPTTFEHNIFINNEAVTGGAIAERKANVLIYNTTIAKNQATIGGALSLDSIAMTLSGEQYPWSHIANSIFYGNQSTDASTFDNIVTQNGAQIRMDYSNIVEPKKENGFVYPGINNMAEDPNFVSLGSQMEWEPKKEYLAGDVITVGAYNDKYVCIISGISSDSEPQWNDLAPEVGNIIEDGTTDPLTGSVLTWQKQAWDNTINVHLKSTAGHYSENGWVYDMETSTSIDKGPDVFPGFPNRLVNDIDYNMTSSTVIPGFWAPLYFEPARNGGKINIGAYGQTMYASKTWDTAGATDAVVVTNPGADDSGTHGLRVGLSVPHKYAIEWIAQGPSFSSSVTVDLDLYKGGVLLGRIDSGLPVGNMNADGVYVGYYDWDIEDFSNTVAMLDYGTDYYIKLTASNGQENLVFSNFTINRYYRITFNTDGTSGATIKDTYGKALPLPYTISVLSGNETPAFTASLPTLGDIKFVNWQWDDPLNPGTIMYNTNNPIDAIVTGDMDITANFGGPLTLTLLNCHAADGSESPITIYESEQIQLVADVPPSGTHFADNWTATPAGGSFDDATKEIVIYTMAGTDVSVSPDFAANATHTLTMIDGTIEPNNTTTEVVSEGQEVVINADDHSTMAVPEHFSSWTVDSGASDGFFKDINDRSTTYTMGTGDVTLKANYMPSKVISFTVVGGVVNPVQTTYYEQTTYELVANTPAPGEYFVKWSTNDGGEFDDDLTSTTHYTTPSNDTTVTAEFRPMPVLTVENGTLPNNGNATSGSFIPGTKIAIAASGTGYFVRWSSNGGGEFTDEFSDKTEFTMPTSDVTITATFSDSPTLIVINGQGSGEYASGSQVEIISQAPAVGEYFAGWTDNVGSSFIDASQMTTSYTMPDRTAVVTANFDKNPILTIVNGTPEGDNPTVPGSLVTVTAKNIPGQYFAHWEAEVNGVQDNSGIADPNKMITVYTMPNSDTTLTAVFTVEPELTVINGIDRSGGGTTHGTGTRVPIMAVAPVAGMHFKGWITESGGSFGDASAISTDYTMPDNKAVVKAVFVWNVNFEVAVDPNNPDVSQGKIIGQNPQEVENNAAALEVTARPNPGYKFASWDDGSTDNPRIVANVTADITYTASFEKDPEIAGVITMGMMLQIPSADFPSGASGKVFGSYVEGGKPKTAPAKQVSAGDPYLAQWVRRIRLYNIKSIKSAYKQGITTDKWLQINPITTSDCMMSVKAGKQTAPLLRPKYLITPPHITALKSWDGTLIDGVNVKGVHMNSIILLEGEYFGSKLPKVYIEYKDYNDKLKHKKLKVLKVLHYPDAKGKESKSCMDIMTGLSELYVQMPRKWWQDWGTKESYLIILDNGFGIDTVKVPTIPSGQNTSPHTGSKEVQSSGKYTIIDVLNNTVRDDGTIIDDGCSDAEADALRITLPSKFSANGAKLSVYKKTKVKYTPAGGSTPDTFSYTVDDGHGGVKNGTVIVK